MASDENLTYITTLIQSSGAACFTRLLIRYFAIEKSLEQESLSSVNKAIKKYLVVLKKVETVRNESQLVSVQKKMLEALKSLEKVIYLIETYSIENKQESEVIEPKVEYIEESRLDSPQNFNRDLKSENDPVFISIQERESLYSEAMIIRSSNHSIGAKSNQSYASFFVRESPSLPLSINNESSQSFSLESHIWTYLILVI